MRTPQYDMSVFQQRREAARKYFKGSALLLAAHPDQIRNNDCHYPYRQDTNLFYLTGFEEPQSVLLFRPGKTPETVMFVLPRDVEMETWNGFRYGPDGAKKQFRADEAFVIDQFEEKIHDLIKDCDKLYYSMFIDRQFDQKVMAVVEKIALARSRTNKGNLTVEDPRPLLGEMRLRKTPFEIEMMRKACKATAEAHVEVMKHTKPGVNERTLHGVFIRAIMERGCAREGYTGIFAGGSNATTLHYVFNDQSLKAGELFLVDAGGEFNFYTSDITRVFPISGQFSPTQKRVYQKMLEIQKDLVSSVKPGVTRMDLQKKAIAGITDLLVSERVLKGDVQSLIEQKEYLKFYPHGVGHWLGSDVHDAGLTEINGEPRPLEPGFILTIEPGLYIPYDTPGVNEELRGLGIRIEDDILVTETGSENLTAACPKEIAEIEALVGRA